MSNIPKLRFPEFTDAWEKCKLENFVEITTGKLDANAMVNDGKYDFYTSGIKKFKINIPAFTGPAITIAGNGATVGFMHLADGEFNAYQRTYVLTKFSNSIREFLFYEIGIKLPRKISAEARTGNIPYIVMDMLTNLDVFTPTVPEQQKIGNLFKQLDHLITLHKRKWDDVILLKKALLQKMFPKNGSDFPEIRFSEFTDAWEKCKLGEIATINPKSTLPQTFNYVDLESVVGTEMRSYKIEKLYSAPSRAQRLAKYGDIFYQTVRPYQKNNYLFELDDENYVFSTGYAQIRSKIYPYFLFTLIQNDRFVNEVLDNCTGTSYPAINATDLKNITIFISNNPIEQQKIGNLFKQLDRLITLHKRQHEHYQLLKKALLQQMFV
ncbi:restriction endonuclease subunit S [Gallibacterium anatis]|uniref:restriction endonuclease subunit S n=1 Tax=Gallibacterium anatis TaxID=750 RepID=UPI00300480AB